MTDANADDELERLRALAHSITGLLTFEGKDGPSLHDAGYRSIVVAALEHWFETYERPRTELERIAEFWSSYPIAKVGKPKG